MKTLKADGVEIAYAEAGSGPALFFVHNGGTSSTIWRHQVADLSSRYRTIVVDLPGFGTAARRPEGVDRKSQVAVLGAVLDELHVDEALGVGNCMGSNLVAELAESRPRTVRGLVLINPLTEATFTHGVLGPLYSVDRYLPWASRTGRNIARHFVPGRTTAVTALRFHFGDKGVAKGLHHDAELLAAFQRRGQLPALIDVLDDMAAYGYLDQVARGRLPPVCTVWGAQNKYLSPRAGARLSEHLGAERAEVLEGCGHLPMLEDPEAVTRVIDEFAGGHLTPN
jgi:pimeloyl-ACP methyl ester carboxylesterase